MQIFKKKLKQKEPTELNQSELNLETNKSEPNSELCENVNADTAVLKPSNKVWTVTKKLSKRWFIDAFSGMAQGLFVTLIAGTIIKQIGVLCGANSFGHILVLIGNFASTLMGAGIGVGIAKYLKASNLVMFGCAVAGFIGAFLPDLVFTSILSDAGFSLETVAKGLPVIMLGKPGNPIGAYVATLFALEIVSLYAGKTKIDILLVPLGILFMSFITMFLAVPAIWLIDIIAKFIEISTKAQPALMGIVISVVMGVLLTMPTSSAAIWITIASANPNSDIMLLAGGAAVVGCACHMVGFAVQSFRENKFSGLISQGIGTSMLQIPNIMRKPIIIVPPIIASIIAGPLATTVFKLRCGATGGGMGTCGFVGVIDTVYASLSAGVSPLMLGLGITILFVVIPVVVTLAVSELFRKLGWIKYGDMSLNYNN